MFVSLHPVHEVLHSGACLQWSGLAAEVPTLSPYTIFMMFSGVKGHSGFWMGHTFNTLANVSSDNPFWGKGNWAEMSNLGWRIPGMALEKAVSCPVLHKSVLDFIRQHINNFNNATWKIRVRFVESVVHGSQKVNAFQEWKWILFKWPKKARKTWWKVLKYICKIGYCSIMDFSGTYTEYTNF